MTDHGKLFSAPMVLALLAGTKTQTRRVIDFQPTGPLKEGDHLYGLPGMYRAGDTIWPLSYGSSIVSNKPGPHPEWVKRHVKVAAGDRLWVREAWRTFASLDKVKPRDLFKMGERGAGILYEADGEGLALSADGTWTFCSRDNPAAFGKLRPGMFLPRWASRLTLPVTEVRVQRLHDITEDDALAEGVVPRPDGVGFWVPGVEHPNPDFPYLARPTAREMYAALWDVLNGSGAWLANPWVSATSFSVHQVNIDDHGRAP